MEDLSLHILDIVQNSIDAGARQVRILILEETEKDRICVEIHDDGLGMDDETQQKALDPFFTTQTTRRIGLGLPLLAQAAREGGGRLSLMSTPGVGTTVRAVFRLSHPDRKPLGDMSATLGTILASRPRLDLVFEYRKDDKLVAGLDSRQPQRTRPEPSVSS